MLTKSKIEKAGYRAIPNGAWLRIDPTIMPHDWESLCESYGADPDCDELVLCVCGVKEVSNNTEEN